MKYLFTPGLYFYCETINVELPYNITLQLSQRRNRQFPVPFIKPECVNEDQQS